MKGFEIELDLDAEQVMWMYHLRYFLDVKRKYEAFLKFRGCKIFLEGGDQIRVKCAAHEVLTKAKDEFVYDFLMQSNNPDENYMSYLDLISNQEYEHIKSQNYGLYIFTKRQFMQVKKELNEKFGYVANFSRPYPLNYVIIFLPADKQSVLIQKIQDLVKQINQNIYQGITPYNSQYQSYRNRDLANRNIFKKVYKIKMRDIQVIQIFLVFDIRRMEEYFNVSFTLEDFNNYMIFVIAGSSDSGCQEVINTVENHLKNKLLYQIQNEQKEFFNQMNGKIVRVEEIEQIANRLDQSFGTEILKRVTSSFSRSNFMFADVQLLDVIQKKQQNEQSNQISKLTNSYYSSQVANQFDRQQKQQDISQIEQQEQNESQVILQIKNLQSNDVDKLLQPTQQEIKQQELNIQEKSEQQQEKREQQEKCEQQQEKCEQQQEKCEQKDNNLLEGNNNQDEEEQQQDLKQLKTIKDHKIQILKEKIIIEFYNYKEKFNYYLFLNSFDEGIFQSDFDAYCQENYYLPNVIQPDYGEQNQLKFIIEVFNNNQQNDLVLIKEFLNNYMNFQIILGIKNIQQLDQEELEEICDDYNCSLEFYNCDLNANQIGWQINNIKPEKNEKGKDIILIFSNIIHCFIEQLKDKVNNIKQLSKKSIITLLFQSQIEIAQNLDEIKKLVLYEKFEFDDCYWAQITSQNPKQIIEKIKEGDSKLLKSVLSKQPQIQKNAIVLEKKEEEKEFYKVFIPELYFKYYENLRRDYLDRQYKEEEWKNEKVESEERLFCVDVTDLEILSSHLEPIIEEIAELDKKGKIIQNINDLQKGIYLIGRTRNQNPDTFKLATNNHIISSIINIK